VAEFPRALKIMNRPRHRTPTHPAMVVGIAAVVLFVGGVGIAVLVGGVDATPQWLRTMAVFLALGLGMAYVLGTAEWAMDVWIMKRACAHIDAGRFDDAAAKLHVYVKQLEKVAGTYDPLTLRWTCTLAHVLLHTGQRMRGMALLALVIDGQLAALGADHPETQRSLRLLEHHTDFTAPIAPIDAWWR
jgi:hypothetical protein